MIGGLRSEVVSVVVYHLLKVSRDSGWKVNRTHLFGSFQLKICGSNKTCEKPVFSGRNIPSGNMCSISSEPSEVCVP